MADALVLLAALALDRWVGEWPAAVHPVVWMGRLVRLVERVGPASGRAAPFAWGLVVAVMLPALCGGVAWLCLELPHAGPALAVFWLKSAFAVRALGAAGEGVARPLAAGDLDEARKRLGWLCSRDATTLTGAQVAAGTIESLAENLSDSFAAPVFWFLVAGVPGAVAYRAVNTLDAMIGYHGPYEWLGKASARLDDLLNFVPARLTAVALLVAARWAGGDVAGGWAVLRRDRRQTESPNARWPMSAIAGLLGVELEKAGHYRLGAGGRVPEGEDVARAWRICRVAAGMMAVGAVAVAAA